MFSSIRLELKTSGCDVITVQQHYKGSTGRRAEGARHRLYPNKQIIKKGFRGIHDRFQKDQDFVIPNSKLIGCIEMDEGLSLLNTSGRNAPMKRRSDFTVFTVSLEKSDLHRFCSTIIRNVIRHLLHPAHHGGSRMTTGSARTTSLWDARIASALKKIIHNSQFKRRISLEEQKAQKEDRFLRGRQIAYLIYDQFRVTGTHDSVENYTDLFTVVLRNDDIQEFDSKWDGILVYDENPA